MIVVVSSAVVFTYNIAFYLWLYSGGWSSFIRRTSWWFILDLPIEFFLAPLLVIAVLLGWEGLKTLRSNVAHSDGLSPDKVERAILCFLLAVSFGLVAAIFGLANSYFLIDIASGLSSFGLWGPLTLFNVLSLLTSIEAGFALVSEIFVILALRQILACTGHSQLQFRGAFATTLLLSGAIIAVAIPWLPSNLTGVSSTETQLSQYLTPAIVSDVPALLSIAGFIIFILAIRHLRESTSNPTHAREQVARFAAVGTITPLPRTGQITAEASSPRKIERQRGAALYSTLLLGGIAWIGTLVLALWGRLITVSSDVTIMDVTIFYIVILTLLFVIIILVAARWDSRPRRSENVSVLPEGLTPSESGALQDLPQPPPGHTWEVEAKPPPPAGPQP